MPLVRYIRSVFETDSSTSAAPGRIQTSESPFQELNGEKYTDNIRITLSNGYFVCGHEQAYPGYTLNTKANGLYFHYVVSGKGLYNGIPFRGQDVFVIRPHTRKLMICDSNDPWELYWCVWKGELAKAMANKLTRFEDNQIYHLKESIRYAELFRYVIYYHHNEKKIEKLVNSFSDMLLSDCSLNDHPFDSYRAFSRRLKALHGADAQYRYAYQTLIGALCTADIGISRTQTPLEMAEIIRNKTTVEEIDELTQVFLNIAYADMSALRAKDSDVRQICGILQKRLAP